MWVFQIWKDRGQRLGLSDWEGEIVEHPQRPCLSLQHHEKPERILQQCYLVLSAAAGCNELWFRMVCILARNVASFMLQICPRTPTPRT